MFNGCCQISPLCEYIDVLKSGDIFLDQRNY